MKFDVTVSALIRAEAGVVYDWLTDLDRFPLWNAGLVEVGRRGRMQPEMIVPVKSMALGRRIESSMEVVRLVPDREIELLNNTGAVPYRAVYRLIPEGTSTELVLWCQLEPQSRIFQLAQPLAESLAKARLSGDLQALKALVEAGSDK